MTELSTNAVARITVVEDWLATYGETVVVYAEGLFDACVCTSLDDEGVDKAMAARPATGTRGWTRSADTHFAGGLTNPCQCDTDPARRHVLYEA